MLAALQESREALYGRAKADPSIAVFDLDRALKEFIEQDDASKYPLHLLMDFIKDSSANWKSSPKVDPIIGPHLRKCLGVSLRSVVWAMCCKYKNVFKQICLMCLR